MGSAAPGLMKSSGNNASEIAYVPPRPLKQVVPSPKTRNFSGLTRAAEVDVEVRIDDEGQVTEARVLNNSSDEEALKNAALSAAKDWIFEPARAHGKKVASYHRIVFHFHGQVEQ
jgi:TonB family protein